MRAIARQSDQCSSAGDTSGVHRPRRLLPLFTAAVCATGALALAGCGGGGDEPSQAERSQAVGQAQVAFRQIEGTGQDLSRGPCIAEQLPGLSDWAADVAHDPRQSVDDDPANQCSSFREGQTHHFVELTPEGNLIKAE
jgi:hypothetical protein